MLVFVVVLLFLNIFGNFVVVVFKMKGKNVPPPPNHKVGMLPIVENLESLKNLKRKCKHICNSTKQI